MTNDVPIDLSASYRVTVSSFLTDGGDHFPVLVQGIDRLGGAVDADAAPSSRVLCKISTPAH